MHILSIRICIYFYKFTHLHNFLVHTHLWSLRMNMLWFFFGFFSRSIYFSPYFCISGSDNIRPYWDHYFQHLDAIIFIVDSGASEEHLKLASNELHKALRNKDLLSIPLLLLANHQDNANARSLDMVSNFLNQFSKEI